MSTDPGFETRFTQHPLVAQIDEAAATAAEDDPRPFLDILRRHALTLRFVTATPDGGFSYSAPWREALGWLSAIGGADLSTARLFEGHLNALQLVSLYGTAAQQRETLDKVRDGAFLGVWGADGAEPARLVRAEAGRAVLTGTKRYASGVGVLDLAVVPVPDEDGAQQLLLLSVDEPERADVSSWNHRGMRRTLSGTYDFGGLTVAPEDRLGAPGDYAREPYFVGGIWRCAAAQLGALEAIVTHVVRGLHASGRDAHPLQTARIGTAILKGRTARLWVEDAASRIETLPEESPAEDIRRAVALSAFARLGVEAASMEIIDLAERALGLGSFAAAHPVEALTRDLSVYIRQANPDAVLAEHGRVLARDLLP